LATSISVRENPEEHSRMRYSGRMLNGSQLERKGSEILGLAWPERKAFVPAKARLWRTAAPVVSQSSAGAAK
jgi:hypothetical protein